MPLEEIHELTWQRDLSEMAKQVSDQYKSQTRLPNGTSPGCVPLILTSDFTLSIPWVFTNKDSLNCSFLLFMENVHLVPLSGFRHGFLSL